MVCSRNVTKKKNDAEHVLYEFKGELLYATKYKMVDHCRDNPGQPLRSITNGDTKSTRICRHLDVEDCVVCVNSLPRNEVGA